MLRVFRYSLHRGRILDTSPFDVKFLYLWARRLNITPKLLSEMLTHLNEQGLLRENLSKPWTREIHMGTTDKKGVVIFLPFDEKK